MQSRDGAKIQGILCRQLVVSEQSIVRLSAEIGASSALRLVGEAVPVAMHENSELFANVAVEPGGGLLWGEVGKNWFDLGSNLDLFRISLSARWAHRWAGVVALRPNEISN